MIMNIIELDNFHTLTNNELVPILSVIRTVGTIVTAHANLDILNCRGLRIHNSNLS